MSSTRHHAEWLSLVEASGPFLSLSVLDKAFPQGLEGHDSPKFQLLRQAYQEWLETCQNVAIHQAWIEWVLEELLEFPPEVLLTQQAIPPGLKVTIPEYQITLRPDWVVVEPDTKKPRLLIQKVPADQGLEKTTKNSRWKASPATRMMELLHSTEVRLGLLTNGEQWMLVNAPKGESTGYISWYSNLWLEEKITLRAFRSLLGVRRFFAVEESETLESLLAESKDAQQEVTDQLGFQVRKAVEVLVQAIDRIDQDRNRQLLPGISETVLYQAALTVMMRLVFLFSAEERHLLLLGDPIYDQFYAVSTLRGQLREQADQHGEELLERRYDGWCRLLATFRGVFGGIHHDVLQLPAYGGELFDPDRFPFLEGRTPQSRWLETPADPIPINNRTVLHLLEALQILQMKVPGGGFEARKLSFRALDIEQIGHVYEGLLDHAAVRATETIVGLTGSKNKEPEIPLAQLETLAAEGEEALVQFLKKQTGRSPNTLKKALSSWQPGGENLGNFSSQKARIACNNNTGLLKRVEPWLNLIRADTFGYPLIIPEGSVFVTLGSDRRETGTHYTPRTLTEEIVKYTLEPLVYEGVTEGKPQQQWRLKSATGLLSLKVCDMAMGSGAFLVEVCRYLAERLVEAWEGQITPPVAGKGQGGAARGNTKEVRILPDGSLSMAKLGEAILPTDPDERLVVARRLVADRCLYGVDKNPMAVEMAKLSLWLVTLQKNRPFTFLDHALRCGDSLLGVTSREQIEFLHLNPDNEDVQLRTVSQIWRPLLDKAIEKRRELENLTVYNLRDLQHKEMLLAEADGLTYNIKIAGDYLIGEAFAQAEKTGNLKVEDLDVVSSQVTAAFDEKNEGKGEGKLREIREKAQRMLNHGKPEGQQPRQPFHWVLEFPEVFLAEDRRAGFDALVGNPPFMGGQKITGTVGTDYRNFLVEEIAGGKRGSADLCAYFFLNAGRLIRGEGNCGLVATNTIAQGDTREVGLDQLVMQGYMISRAVPSRRWPGTAALEVAYVWLHKGKWQQRFILNNHPVEGITAFLTVPGKAAGNPHKLVANSGKSFQGSIVLGMGFVLTREEAEALVAKNPKNKDVLFPYLNGQDLNTNPDQSPSRWVINFFDWPLDAEHDDPKKPKGPPYAADYPDCLEIVEKLVKPERDKNNRKIRRERWWQFAERCPALYEAIKKCDRVLVCALVSKRLIFSFSTSDIVFAHKLAVFPFQDVHYFAIMQSVFHVSWSWYYSSTMRDAGINYSPSDCFETFPFPEKSDLEEIGEKYYKHRQSIMKTRQEGLTTTYNRFHSRQETDAEIQRLRDLHMEMDKGVAAAYGWEDIDLNHDFHETKQGLRFTIAERARGEILDRLLRLNHQRYAEEVAAGLHDKKRGKKTGKKKPQTASSNYIQGTLL
ncbi:MAG: restriction endonuclease [Arthrospira sp. PLM2.Bin9]|nr:DNA methyltransferase [Arthrospira sp. PLM2.Bin9]TVU54640.1 MAG: restriction endonuclease [Arthrospira sp. PLM2.Bin9]